MSLKSTSYEIDVIELLSNPVKRFILKFKLPSDLIFLIKPNTATITLSMTYNKCCTNYYFVLNDSGLFRAIRFISTLKNHLTIENNDRILKLFFFLSFSYSSYGCIAIDYNSCLWQRLTIQYTLMVYNK